MKKNQFLYWRMANGHEHSFLMFDTENIYNEYATENEAGEINQKEYQVFVSGREHTYIEEEIVEDFTELTEELAQKWLDKDYIADFEVDEGEIIIEFY